MTHPRAHADFDAVVVGAGFGFGFGFGGIYLLHKLRDELGLSVRAFDKAGGVGGTWFWNRSPGALSDSEAFVYQYAFDPGLSQEWELTRRYAAQPQILAYLEHVVDRYGLAREMALNTGVTSAHFDEPRKLWSVVTDTAETLTAHHLITALAPQVGHLTVFQRSPQYSVPSGNGPLPCEFADAIKANSPSIWADVRNSALGFGFGFGFAESTVPLMSGL
ncbi:hypothetical protein [Mycobacterium sp.]|uniref:hypothetical protein n=1 Tax=Mycobacterium sp. TaxID=1785 RepID=UPI0031E347DD